MLREQGTNEEYQASLHEELPPRVSARPRRALLTAGAAWPPFLHLLFPVTVPASLDFSWLLIPASYIPAALYCRWSASSTSTWHYIHGYSWPDRLMIPCPNRFVSQIRFNIPRFTRTTFSTPSNLGTSQRNLARRQTIFTKCRSTENPFPSCELRSHSFGRQVSGMNALRAIHVTAGVRPHRHPLADRIGSQVIPLSIFVTQSAYGVYPRAMSLFLNTFCTCRKAGSVPAYSLTRIPVPRVLTASNGYEANPQ